MTGDVRVRFAPSPTGHLHMGNARTALFNWLFAEQHSGTFILRIEDTDVERSVMNYEESICQDLRWLGLHWQEGPDVGGPYGPYRQSERISIYRYYIDELIRKGYAYPCYCSEEELEKDRTRQLSEGRAPKYSGRCRNLSDHERIQLEREGRVPTIRFKVDRKSIKVDDMIRGIIHFEGALISDFIILKSNGIPSYNFAVVVDDALMKVSHVIRGEDHIPNTPRQLMLYDALGFSPPRFAHHGFLVGPDKEKLSKRHGVTSVEEFRTKGFLPEALMNYLALVGGSFKGGREILGREELIREFSIERMGRSSAVFDKLKLEWMNTIYLRGLKSNEVLARLTPFLESAGYDINLMDREWLLNVVSLILPNICTLSEALNYLDIFLKKDIPITDSAFEVLKDKTAMDVIGELKELVKGADNISHGAYKEIIEKIKGKTGLTGRPLFMPIRVVLTGTTKGPELEKIFPLLNKEVIIKRIDQALSTLPQRQSQRW